MTITFNCAQCGKSYTLDDSLAGKQAKCPCGTKMTVPAPPAPVAPVPPAPVAPVSPAPVAPESPFEAPPMPAPQPYAQQASMQQVIVNQGSDGKSDKQKIVAALLCWFLGLWGIHRFYLGHTGIGLIQLFTLGMCGVWTFIDFIMILTGGVKDIQGRPLS